ncbi:hypothetical protein JCM1840_000802 [Sporobolomyces johnsonii]
MQNVQIETRVTRLSTSLLPMPKQKCTVLDPQASKKVAHLSPSERNMLEILFPLMSTTIMGTPPVGSDHRTSAHSYHGGYWSSTPLTKMLALRTAELTGIPQEQVTARAVTAVRQRPSNMMKNIKYAACILILPDLGLAATNPTGTHVTKWEPDAAERAHAFVGANFANCLIWFMPTKFLSALRV